MQDETTQPDKEPEVPAEPGPVENDVELDAAAKKATGALDKFDDELDAQRKKGHEADGT